MKRWLLRLGLAGITFSLGCGVYFFFRDPLRRNQGSSDPLPYCQVARNAEQYHNTNILVKARIVVDDSSWGVYVFEDCDPVEALAAGVVIDPHHPPLAPEYVDKLLVTGYKPHVKTAQALIEGHFDAHASTGCWTPKFQIHAKKIELLSSPTDYITPQSEKDQIRTRH